MEKIHCLRMSQTKVFIKCFDFEFAVGDEWSEKLT